MTLHNTNGITRRGFVTRAGVGAATLSPLMAATKSATQSRKNEAVGQTLDHALGQAFPAPVPLVCLGQDGKAASGLSYIRHSAAARDKSLAYYIKPARSLFSFSHCACQRQHRNLAS